MASSFRRQLAEVARDLDALIVVLVEARGSSVTRSWLAVAGGGTLGALEEVLVPRKEGWLTALMPLPSGVSRARR